MTVVAADRKFFNPAQQTLPREVIREEQDRAIRALADRIWDAPIPFYLQKLEAAGLSRRDLVSVTSLTNVPITRKDELRENQATVPPFGSFQGAPFSETRRIGTTGGTTGRPLFLQWTNHDLALEVEIAWRVFWRYGLRPGMRATHCIPGGLYGGGGLLTHVLEANDVLCVQVPSPVTPEEGDRAIEIWELTRPQFAVMFGPAALGFRDAALRRGALLDDFGIETIWLAEAVCQFAQPANAYSAFFGPYVGASSGGGLEAFIAIGGGCEEHEGGHFAEDHIVVEVVDPDTGEPVEPGERGELVYTTLQKDHFILRYAIEDLGRMIDDPCSCGETYRRLVWEGRKSDIVRVDAVSILPIDVHSALLGVADFRRSLPEFQLLRSPGQQRLDLRVEVEETAVRDTRRLALQCEQELERVLRVPAHVEVAAAAGGRPAYKPTRVVDWKLS